MRAMLVPGMLLAALALRPAPAPAAQEAAHEGRTVSEWRAVLDGKDGKQRARAAAALARIGAPAAEALPSLAKAVVGATKDESLRVNAALALGRIGGSPDRLGDGPSRLPPPGEPADGPPDAPPAKDPPAKPDPDGEARARRIRELVLPALQKALRDPCGDVRSNAALSLLYLRKEGSPAAGALAKALGDPSVNLRRNAAAALGVVDPDPALVLGPLGKALADADATVADSAADALGALGAAALPALGDLRAALRRDVAAPRSTLDRMPRSAGVPTWPTLSCDLCLALGRIGRAAEPALPEVFLALRAKNVPARNAALQAVSAIRGDPAASVAAVLPLLEDGEESIRGLAALVLSDFGPDARSALPALEKLRDASTGSVRQNAQAAIDRIGGKAVATGAGEEAPTTPGGFSIICWF